MRSLISLLFLIMCSTKSTAQTYIEPVFDRTDVPSLHINKIKVTKDTTYVHCTYRAEAGSWARIAKDTYLYDIEKQKKYPILRCSGFPFSPQQRDFRFGGSFDILFCFSNIGKATRLDFIENPNEETFNVYGINLRENNGEPYKEEDFEHFSNMATLWYSSNNTQKALEYKRNEVEAAIYIYGIKSKTYFNSLLTACLMYDDCGLYDEAVKGMTYLKEIHAAVWGDQDKYNYALFLRTLGQIYSHASNYEMSIKTNKESIELFESLHAVDKEYALALRFLAYDYNEMGDNESALLYQRKALETRRAIGDSNNYINELYNVILSVQDDKEIANSHIEIAERELVSLPDFVDSTSVAFVDIYKKLAYSYTLLDKNENAIKFCDKALTLLGKRREDKSEKYAEILGEKCRYQRYAGHQQESIITGDKGTMLFDSLCIKSTKYADLLNDLAVAYSDIYDYEKAIQMLEKANAIYEGTQDWLSLAEGLNHIGNCYRNKYDLDNAEIFIKKGLDVLSQNVTTEQYVLENINEAQRQKTFSVVQDRIQRAKSGFYNNLANVYSEKGENDKAIEAEKNAVEILRNRPDDEDLYISYLGELAILYKKDARYDEAIEIEERCLNFWEDYGDKVNISLSQSELASLYFEKGDTIRAIGYADEAVLTSRSIGDKLEIAEGLGFLSILYWKSSKYEEAEKCLSEALDYIQIMLQPQMKEMTSEQKQRIWNKYRNYFILYRDIVYKGEKDERKLSKLYDYVLFSKSLLIDSDLFNDELSARLNITWKDVQKKLTDTDIAIEFIATIEERTDTIQYGVYHALVIDKECQYPQMITLLHEKELGTRPETIGDLIWEPILIKYPKIKNIYFSADGVWNALPIENLLMTKTPFLLENYNIYRLSSTKELIKSHKKSIMSKAVLYGGLTYSSDAAPDLAMAKGEKRRFFRGIEERGGFEPLYNTFIEAKEIQDILEQGNVETFLFTEENGTEESFKLLSGKNVSLIHLATHGMYVDVEDLEKEKDESNFVFLESVNEKDPVMEDVALSHSFLVMSDGNKLAQREEVFAGTDDGILTAQEISKMNLNGLDLVVLSACESALGVMTVSDGILGLQRGFKKAGANTILMSYKKINDEATRILMVEFYKNLISGKSKLQSLKEAQKYLREYDNGKYLDPQYWQSFIMLDGLD